MLASTTSLSATGSPRRLFRRCEGEERHFLGKAGTGAGVILYSVPILVKPFLVPPSDRHSNATDIVLQIVRVRLRASENELLKCHSESHGSNWVLGEFFPQLAV